MTLLVISDTHGRADRLQQVLDSHRGADGVLFLGDGLRDWSRVGELPVHLTPIAVRGNCDGLLSLSSDGQTPVERMVAFGRIKILMLHGHTKGVKHGIETAAGYAAGRGADLLLYGHTHVAEETYLPAGEQVGGVTLQKPLWIFNPGSLGQPREGAPSYGLVTIRNGQLLLSHGRA